MSTLIALVFDDPYKADEARAALLRLEGEGLIELEETAVIAKKEGERVRISQDTNVIANRKQAGHVLGIIAANLTGTMPLIFIGTVVGRLVGRFTDDGVTNKFINQVKKDLVPGTSALLLCGSSAPAHRQKVFERLSQFTPKVLESDLPPELEREVERRLQGQRAAAG
jgi:uncharacterized membrane protein